MGKNEDNVNICLNDVWKSTDGETWQVVTLNAEFNPIKEQAAFV